MSADVYSHRGAPRKRAPSRGWTARRLLAVALALAALIAVAWVAPYLHPASTKTDVQIPQPPVTGFPAPELPFPLAEEAPAPVVRARPQRPHRTGVPLDAPAASPGEDYEVLSASELDAISQARDE